MMFKTYFGRLHEYLLRFLSCSQSHYDLRENEYSYILLQELNGDVSIQLFAGFDFGDITKIFLTRKIAVVFCGVGVLWFEFQSAKRAKLKVIFGNKKLLLLEAHPCLRQQYKKQ